MAHNIITQNDKNIFYCTKCGANSIDSKDLLRKLCNSALHEEELENKRIRKEELENKRIAIEERKLSLYVMGLVIAIISILGFFTLIHIGFKSIAVPLENMVVIAKSVYK